TPSRRRIFVCRPASRSAEGGCAKQIVSTLARRAYRRPVADGDVQPLLTFFETGRREGGFDTGIERALQVILASPKFVFRIEQGDGNRSAPTPVPPLELASRLSFFLWSSIPDDELLAKAGDGTLGQPKVLEQQVRRMLADPRAGALTANF